MRDFAQRHASFILIAVCTIGAIVGLFYFKTPEISERMFLGAVCAGITYLLPKNLLNL